MESSASALAPPNVSETLLVHSPQGHHPPPLVSDHFASRPPTTTLIVFYLKVAFFNVLLSLALLETVLAAMLALPGVYVLLPQPALTFLRILYKQSAMPLIPPECARHDPHLTYTLQPGTCLFSGKEFSNTLRINSQGLRDDEDSLRAPQIIVLGDSHAMGWGVDQEDTFPQLIERQSGLKVLNAAIASYGTVRQRRLLDRIDTTRLTYLIIQYCDNDYLENRAFIQNNNDFRITPADEYQRHVERYRRQQPYYPGKYTVVSVRKAAEVWKARRDKRYLDYPGRQREIEYFLNALINAGRTRLENVRIIVFEAQGRLRTERRPIRNHTQGDTRASPDSEVRQPDPPDRPILRAQCPLLPVGWPYHPERTSTHCECDSPSHQAGRARGTG